MFAGENHMITLFEPNLDTAIASISCWRCNYSDHGEGYTLALWYDSTAMGSLGMPETALFTDNAPMSRIVMSRFNQYFEGYERRGLADLTPVMARFNQQFGGKRFHRILCASAIWTIELEWKDVLDGALEVFDNDSGPERYDVSAVICPCREGTIRVNGVAIPGRIRPAGNEVSSSAFLAFSETWVAQKS